MKLSEKQVEMLRLVARAPNSACSVPYRRGADSTALSLGRLGLVCIFFGPNSGRMMAMTDAGRRALSAADPKGAQ